MVDTTHNFGATWGLCSRQADVALQHSMRAGWHVLCPPASLDTTVGASGGAADAAAVAVIAYFQLHHLPEIAGAHCVLVQPRNLYVANLTGINATVVSSDTGAQLVKAICDISLRVAETQRSLLARLRKLTQRLLASRDAVSNTRWKRLGAPLRSPHEQGSSLCIQLPRELVE